MQKSIEIFRVYFYTFLMFSFLFFLNNFFTSNDFKSERFSCSVVFIFSVENHDFTVWEIA